MLNRAAFGLLAAALLAALTACSRNDEPELPDAARMAPPPAPVARWDHLPQGDRWTNAVLKALDGHGTPLVQTVPADASTWCPAYPEATEAGRKAFWVGLLSALAKHESTWRPDVSGGNGRWHGLLQISPGTARGYGCRAQGSEALKDGAANLSCAVRIMAVTVPRDGVVSQGMRGVAADWGPFHQRAKREEMIAWMRAQPYCRG